MNFSTITPSTTFSGTRSSLGGILEHAAIGLGTSTRQRAKANWHFAKPRDAASRSASKVRRLSPAEHKAIAKRAKAAAKAAARKPAPFDAKLSPAVAAKLMAAVSAKGHSDKLDKLRRAGESVADVEARLAAAAARAAKLDTTPTPVAKPRPVTKAKAKTTPVTPAPAPVFANLAAVEGVTLAAAAPAAGAFVAFIPAGIPAPAVRRKARAPRKAAAAPSLSFAAASLYYAAPDASLCSVVSFLSL